MYQSNFSRCCRGSSRFWSRCFGWISAAAVVFSALPAVAGDGRIEINQTCAAQTGCMPGDSAGFPVTLGQSGSYLLTSNLTVSVVNVSAIRVDSPGVSIDLNGFTIGGPVECVGGSAILCSPTASAGAGVRALGASIEVAVRHGIIHGFHAGLQLSGECLAEDLIVFSNSTYGIVGGDCVVRDSIVNMNGGNAIDLDQNSEIVGVVATQNGVGIRGRSGTTLIAENLVWSNISTNLAIRCNNGCSVMRNMVMDNSGDGIQTGDANLIKENLIAGNGNRAINTGVNSGFTRNVISWETGAHGVVGGVYMSPNSCRGQLTDVACRFEP